MQLRDALARFLVQLQADGRSPHTIGQYRRHVGRFGAWLAQVGHTGDLAAVGHEVVARFLAAPDARTSAHGGGPKAAVTMNALRTSLRMFFRYLHQAGMIPDNPARLVRRALCSPPPPRAMPDADRDRLLGVIAAADGDAARRDHALFHVLAATGMRIGSAVALRVEDVDLERGEIRVRTMKGSRPDVVYLSREIAEHLRRYIGDRPRGPLFPGARGHAITTRHAQRRFRRWLRAAGVRTAASPHALRHAFAADLLRRTGNLALVQAALSHRSIQSTLQYARVDAGAVRAAIG